TTPETNTLSLHDALPIWGADRRVADGCGEGQGGDGRQTVHLLRRRCRGSEHGDPAGDQPTTTGETKRFGLSETLRVALAFAALRSEEHTSELQSRENLVC